MRPNTCPFLRSSVTGTLITINQRLQAEPGLITSDPLGEGHVAIVLLKSKGASALITEED